MATILFDMKLIGISSTGIGFMKNIFRINPIGKSIKCFLDSGSKYLSNLSNIQN